MEQFVTGKAEISFYADSGIVSRRDANPETKEIKQRRNLSEWTALFIQLDKHARCFGKKHLPAHLWGVSEPEGRMAIPRRMRMAVSPVLSEERVFHCEAYTKDRCRFETGKACIFIDVAAFAVC